MVILAPFCFGSCYAQNDKILIKNKIDSSSERKISYIEFISPDKTKVPIRRNLTFGSYSVSPNDSMVAVLEGKRRGEEKSKVYVYNKYGDEKVKFDLDLELSEIQISDDGRVVIFGNYPSDLGFSPSRLFFHNSDGSLNENTQSFDYGISCRGSFTNTGEFIFIAIRDTVLLPDGTEYNLTIESFDKNFKRINATKVSGDFWHSVPILTINNSLHRIQIVLNKAKIGHSNLWSLFYDYNLNLIDQQEGEIK